MRLPPAYAFALRYGQAACLALYEAEHSTPFDNCQYMLIYIDFY